jgi:hypothetical protein
MNSHQSLIAVGSPANSALYPTEEIAPRLLGLWLPLAGMMSVGLALLRSCLLNIDVIIRRTLVYTALTLALGLVYVGAIVVSRTLVAPLIGGSELAIVASTVTIAALFNPLRKRIQNVIDRRFYRRKHDASQVLAAFGATMRDETNLNRLIAEMLHTTCETVQPEFVGLWLRQPERGIGQ